jgi:hypothetical protein
VMFFSLSSAIVMFTFGCRGDMDGWVSEQRAGC